MTDEQPTPIRAGTKPVRRRGHNEGSVYQLKDSSWRGAVTFLDAESG